MQFPDPLLSMQKRRILTILKFLVLNIFQFGDTHILQYECPYCWYTAMFIFMFNLQEDVLPTCDFVQKKV